MKAENEILVYATGLMWVRLLEIQQIIGSKDKWAIAVDPISKAGRKSVRGMINLNRLVEKCDQFAKKTIMSSDRFFGQYEEALAKKDYKEKKKAAR